MKYENIEIEIDGEPWSPPLKWGICENCDGEGRHIHNAFREEAFTVYDAEREGLDFEEEVGYMQSGAYDVTCDVCHGTGKVKVPDWRRMTEEQRRLVNEWIQDELDFEATCRAERMMGC